MKASSAASSSAQIPLWTSAEAQSATDGVLSGRSDWAATGINFDSRLIEPGDLFVALKSDAADGHDYIASAFDRGAVAAVASYRPSVLPADVPLIEVADTLTALEGLGRFARARAKDVAVIAVTGSVGKTSTKDMLACLLAGFGATHAAAKSFNNHIGVPLTLARMPASTRFGVFEVGMNAPGEIAPLAQLVRPHIAVITAVAPVHTEAFARGVEGIVAEKASIVEGLEPGGKVVLDRGSPHFERLAGIARETGAEVLEFGLGAEHAPLIDIDVRGDVTTVSARLFEQDLTFAIGAPGRHFASNALAALLAVQALGVDAAQAARALAGWRALGGRGARSRRLAPGGELLLVDESYNANPASMAAALETVSHAEPGRSASGADGRRIAFLTDMLELGAEGAAMHAALAKAPGIERMATVHCAGPLMAALHAALPSEKRGRLFGDAAAMAAAAPELVGAGDVALIKGSNGSRAGDVAEALRAAFPEAN